MFHAADQTLSVFEPPQPNTGLPGGRFLERAKVYKPGSKLVRGLGRVMSPTGRHCVASGQGPRRSMLPRSPTLHLQAWYTEAEMAVGQVLDLHGRRFRLTAADAFTAQWQAQNAAHEGECVQAQGTK